MAPVEDVPSACSVLGLDTAGQPPHTAERGSTVAPETVRVPSVENNGNLGKGTQSSVDSVF